jgi:hypothetical protein
MEELKIAFPARNPDFGIIIPNQEKLDNQNEIEMRLKTLPEEEGDGSCRNQKPASRRGLYISCLLALLPLFER